MAAGEASSNFEAKTTLWCAIFALVFYPTRHQIDGKIRYVPLWKNYVVNVYKICFHIVVFLYWSTTASLGPRFLKMKYCGFTTCVCLSMLWTRFQAVFTLFPDRQWKSCNLLEKHCRLWGKNLKRNGRDHGKESFEAVLSEKVHVNIGANDTSNVHPKTLCAAWKAKLKLYRLSSLNEEDEAVVRIKKEFKVFLNV